MFKGVFTGSLQKAKELNAVPYYHASHKENVFCKNMIEWMLSNRYDGEFLYNDCAGDLCAMFGVERVAWVLANTVQHRSWDRRIGKGNLEWASKFLIPTDPENHTEEYCVCAHAELVGELVWQLRGDCALCEIADYSECVMEETYGDYSDKLLIIAPGSLCDVYRTRDHQYAYVDCYERDCSTGEARIHGRQIVNGNEVTLYDHNVLGVADESLLADWATEKLAKMRSEVMQMRGAQ